MKFVARKRPNKCLRLLKQEKDSKKGIFKFLRINKKKFYTVTRRRDIDFQKSVVELAQVWSVTDSLYLVA